MISEHNLQNLIEARDARIKELEAKIQNGTRTCEDGCPLVATLRRHAEERSQAVMKLCDDLDRAATGADLLKEKLDEVTRNLNDYRSKYDQLVALVIERMVQREEPHE